MEIIKTWFSKKKKNIGFEDVKYAISNREQYILINTLSTLMQDCLIIGTLPYTSEEHTINRWIEQGKKPEAVYIILYGKNAVDDSTQKKYDQLQQLGFDNVYIYAGGLFEWLLLQDVYGYNEFPTTTKCKDMLRFRPSPVIPRFSLSALTY